jgi:hypothetical protein
VSNVRVAELWPALLAAWVPACILVSDFEGLDDGPRNATDAGSDASLPSDSAVEAETSNDTGTCDTSTFKLCSAVPAAPAGFVQTVDGSDEDFCDAPSTVFLPQQGRFHTCGPESDFMDGANAVVTTKIVWSTSALHVFVRVEKDPSIPIVTDVATLYKGDAIELFFANREEPTGNLAADEAIHLIVAPPEEGGVGYISSQQPFTGEFLSVRANGSYVVELSIPWSMLGGQTPNTGLGVVLNLGVDITGPNGERYQSFLEYTAPDGGDLFCKDTSQPTPSESTLTWCKSTLQ